MNVRVYCLIKCTASALTRSASHPQQRACAYVYADSQHSPDPLVGFEEGRDGEGEKGEREEEGRDERKGREGKEKRER